MAQPGSMIVLARFGRVEEGRNAGRPARASHGPKRRPPARRAHQARPPCCRRDETGCTDRCLAAGLSGHSRACRARRRDSRHRRAPSVDGATTTRIPESHGRKHEGSTSGLSEMDRNPVCLDCAMSDLGHASSPCSLASVYTHSMTPRTRKRQRLRGRRAAAPRVPSGQ